jgi:hypothetical protein
MDVERRRVAGTYETILIIQPRHGAAEVSAFSDQCQEAAVLEPHQIELALGKCRDGAGIESIHKTGDHYRRFVCRLSPVWTQEVEYYPDGLHKRNDGDAEPCLGKEAAA